MLLITPTEFFSVKRKTQGSHWAKMLLLIPIRIFREITDIQTNLLHKVNMLQQTIRTICNRLGLNEFL